jgi:hypothetical protein
LSAVIPRRRNQKKQQLQMLFHAIHDAMPMCKSTPNRTCYSGILLEVGGEG